MIKYLILCLLTCFSFQLSCFSQETSGLNEEQKIKMIAETFDAIQNHRTQNIWPNLDFHTAPTIVHFKNEHVYAFRFPNPSNKWKGFTENHQSILFSEQDHWGLAQTMLHPNFEVEGKSSFVFSLDDNAKRPHAPILTFLHERFHLHQFQHFNRQDEMGANYQDHWNEENLSLIAIEDDLLRKFLLSYDQPQEVRMEYLKDFVAVNQARYRLLQPSSMQWEDVQQRMEGLADYVSVKLFEFIEPSFNPGEHLVEVKSNDMSRYASLFNHAIKDRHYFVGAALGMALDFCQVSWQQEVEDGAPLRFVLMKAIPMSEQEKNDRVQRLKQSSLFHEATQYVSEYLDKEDRKMQELLDDYDNLEGVEVAVAYPLQPVSGGGKKYKSYFLQEGGMVSLTDSSCSISQDRQWKLTFEQMPYIFDEPTGMRAFKMENDATICVDNQTMTLKEIQEAGKPIEFTSLKLKGQTCELTAGLCGVIYVDEGRLHIEFHK